MSPLLFMALAAADAPLWGNLHAGMSRDQVGIIKDVVEVGSNCQAKLEPFFANDRLIYVQLTAIGEFAGVKNPAMKTSATSCEKAFISALQRRFGPHIFTDTGYSSGFNREFRYFRYYRDCVTANFWLSYTRTRPSFARIRPAQDDEFKYYDHESKKDISIICSR